MLTKVDAVLTRTMKKKNPKRNPKKQKNGASVRHCSSGREETDNRAGNLETQTLYW